MRIYDLREYIYDVVCQYFTKARVVWSDEVKEKPRLPLVMLTIRNLVSAPFPNIAIMHDDENKEDSDPVIQFYPSSVTLEVDNFTQRGTGRHDHAVPDLYEFVKYLNSDEVVDKLFMDDISITQEGPIQPVSMVMGQDHEYRAMAEFTVNFMQVSAGAYGIAWPENEMQYDYEARKWKPHVPVTENDWQPTSSGGGDHEMENSAAFIFSEVEVEMKESEEE